MSRATTKEASRKVKPTEDPLQKWIDDCCDDAKQNELDRTLKDLSREQALDLPAKLRIRWFHRSQIWHRELKRVRNDLNELLDPWNEVKLISLIGMTGIGKSSLAIYLLEGLLRTRWGDHAPHEIPLIYVKAPANGDKSLSWKVLYTSILVGGGEVMHLHKLPLNRRDKRSVAKAVKHASNRAQVLEYRVKGKAGLAEIRGFLDKMLRERRVKLVVIDEVFHLLRFNDYAATMDTLKSLSDETETGKLMLIGNYDIADLVMDYAQVVRRGEIVHFKAYKWRTFVEGPLTEDEIEFKAAVEKLHKLWPCRRVPDLPAIWHQLMRASLGSVGMLKLILLRLAAQQMRSKSGESLPNEEMLAKSMKSPKALEKIMAETEAGEEKLLGACYGNSIFSGEELQSMCKALAKQVEKEAEHA